MGEEQYPLGAIPERLRCAICTALAREAWKLACCDHIICGSCFESLPTDACTICDLSPLRKDEAQPSTSLRTTIAVFLRHAEKRHKDAIAREARLQTHSESLDLPEPTKLRDATIAFQRHNQQPDLRSHNQKDTKDYKISSDNEELLEVRAENAPRSHQSADQGYQGGIAAGFSPANGYMDPLLMTQMMMGGFGGYVNNGLARSTNMMPEYLQNMNMQSQNFTLPDFAQPIGASGSDFAYRNSQQAVPIHSGDVNNFRGRGPFNQSTFVTPKPVFVEGAPTGPAAMRNSVNSGVRSGHRRGEEKSDRGLPNQNNSVSNHRSEVVPDINTDDRRDPRRGRPATRSISRDKSRSEARRKRRERSVSSASRDSRVEHKPRHKPRRRSRSHRQQSPVYEAAGKKDVVTSQSLADRVAKIPVNHESRSSSLSPRRGKSSRSHSHRHRSRSGSKDRPTRQRSSKENRRRKSRREHCERQARDLMPTDRHLSEKSPDVILAQDKGDEESTRNRTTDKSRSRRSRPRFEISNSELRRAERDRERSRYS